jgi:hypothetical protein
MKDFNTKLWIILTFLTYIGMFPGFGQDLIVLESGLEIESKIISKEDKNLSYYNWDDVGGIVYEVNKRSVRWYRFEYMTKKRIALTFSMGGVPYSTANYLKKYMRDHGYEGTSQGIAGSISYPVSHVKMPVLIEFEYLFKPPHGITFEFAHSNAGSVQGLINSGYTTGLIPEITYSNPQFSLSYKYYFKSFKSALQAGVIMNNAKIKEVYDNYFHSREVKDSSVRWGFLIGYAGSLVEREQFFIRFQTQFRYIFPVEYDNYDLFMNREKIGLSHLFIGIQTGVKIYTDKK